MRLDDTDLEIVRILHEDGRTSYSDIAKLIGVSAGTVRNRITHMRSSGILYFNVWLDPYRSGMGVNATLLIKTKPGQLKGVIEVLVGLDETGYVATLAGTYDAIVDAFCRDIPHLRKFIHDKIQMIDGIIDVSTHLVTETKYQSRLNVDGVFSSPMDDQGAASNLVA